MNEWTIDNINDFQQIINLVMEKATKNAAKNDHAAVVALHGNLGSGKTTFTKQLAKHLGITETVTSPTFIIQKRFEINGDDNRPFKKLIHIDTYRIDLQDELVRLGWNEDLNDPQNLISLEWPENVPDILPADTIHIYFEFINETTRKISLE